MERGHDEVEKRRAGQRRAKPTEEEIKELRELFCNRWYSASELAKIQKRSGRRFKRGKWSDKEKQLLRDGLKQYLDERSMTMDEFLNTFFNKKTQSRQVYDDKRFGMLFRNVAMKTDGRPVLLAYQCMRRMFHPGNMRGKWSAESDAELKRLFGIYGPDWETIGKHLDRYGMSCRDRYRSFRGKFNVGPWSEDEVARLKEAISEKQHAGDSRPSWIVVSQHVATRSVVQCQIKWISVHSRARNNEKHAAWSGHLDYYLVSRIYDLAVEHESEIIWRDLVDDSWSKYFHQSALRNRWLRLKKRVANERTMDIDLILEHLLLTLPSPSQQAEPLPAEN